MLVDPKNEECIGVLCSNIVEQVYRLLSMASSQSKEAYGFYGYVINYLSQCDNNSLDEAFTSVAKVFSLKLEIKKVEKVFLFNLLTHIFVEQYLPGVIKVYRNKEMVLPNLNSDVTKKQNCPIINTSDVNRIFGWAIFKERKLVVNLIKRASMSHNHEMKLSLLDNMIVSIKEVCLNENYIKIYVPTDDLIRNKGDLTYICPKYVFLFAQILTVITEATKVNTKNAIFEKPDKDEIKKRLFKSETNCHVQRLVNKVLKDNIELKCGVSFIELLIRQLVERVLNAIVGGQVKYFRAKQLSHVNDVNFRENLKVKCEQAYI